MILQNKVAVITGSSSGIGKAIALLFAQEGASVVLCSNSSVNEGNVVLSEVKQFGNDCKYYSVDLRHEENKKKCMNK